MSGAFRVLWPFSLVFGACVSCKDIGMYQHIQEWKYMFFLEFVGKICTPTTDSNLIDTTRYIFPGKAALHVETVWGGKRGLWGIGFFNLHCSSCHFYISDNKLKYVPFDACIPTGLGKTECPKDDVIWLPSQSEALLSIEWQMYSKKWVKDHRPQIEVWSLSCSQTQKI